ncbi:MULTISPECIES: IclR family transcriptional regulator [Pontibacillus]|uniref:IclR family transcriptional regulator n=1 Tax=Pontibacillus chungwhensis TaxID=265426 RepID=A0ABY8UT86_9BACI|nr:MULTISPECIES: IclR family transcriptional regulator [Pontibacillus]MCD5322853.1 IclR family transcriptional regulator [Pontibacillus sp. HN14]WIF96252.1 IclR family transcriptional regulator [Pontibacillus chungwhensis]
MNQSVLKALKLLDYFTEETPELTLRELTTKSNIPKPTVYRLLVSLEQAGFLMKTKESEHDSRYRLGIKLMELGYRVADQIELRRIAKPYMEQLAQEINEVIHLVIVNEDKATYIEKVDSNRALRLYTKIGKNAPLYLGSGPKLLLAYLPPSRQEKVLNESSLSPIANLPPIDKETLKRELKIIREQGYAISKGEQDHDTTGISYPIYNYKHEVVASLAVSGLSNHFEGKNLTVIKEATERIAHQVSRSIGY